MLMDVTRSKFIPGALVAVASVASIALTGCGAVTAAAPTSSLALSAQSGRAMGGQQPVSNSTITLWKAGTTGYGVGASPLYTTSTDANGYFDLTSHYSCASGDQLYVTAYGGSSSAGAGTNGSIGLMAALGECNAVKATPSIGINEATTVASMTALQQFTKVTFGTSGSASLAASSTNVPLNIGTSSTNLVGLTNAFATVNNLAPAALAPALPLTYARTATVAGSSATVTVTSPAAKVATMANILASCVNTNDTSGAPSSSCTSLFTSVKPTTQTFAAADTIQAALDLATNPSNVGGTSNAPYSLGSASPPFQPALTAPPNDWTLSLSFTSSSVVGATTTTASFLAATSGLQIDSSGNVYVLNNIGTDANATSPYNNSVAEFSPIGTPVAIYLNDSVNSSISNPNSFVLDPNNNIWVGEKFGADIVKYVDSTHTVHARTNSQRPLALASDSAGNIFVAAADGKLYEAPAGISSYSQSTPIGTLGTIAPSYLAFDSSLNLWVTGTSTSSTTTDQFLDVFTCAPGVGTVCSNTTTNTYAAAKAFTSFPVVNSVTGFPAGIAFDKSDNAFITATNYYNLSSSSYSGNFGCEFVLTLATEATTTVPGCSTNALAGLERTGQAEVDGNGNVWIVDETANTAFGQPISGINYNAGTFTSVSGSKGYPATTLANTTLMQLDQSGNAWTAAYNFNSQSTITEIVGVVAPVYAPLSLALKNGKLGQTP
jgi:hypothetical protein